MSPIGYSRIAPVIVAAAFVLVAASGAAVAKSQHTKQCKPDAHTGSQTPISHPSTAKVIAAKIWSSEVAGIHGASWAYWSNAIAKSVQCTQVSVPTRVICVAVGRPCRYIIQPTETHPPYPNMEISIGIGGFGFNRPGRLHRPPRGLGRPHLGGSPGRRLR